MPTLEQIQSDIIISLKPHYRGYIEAIYQATLTRNKEAIRLTNKNFNSILPKENRCGEYEINSLIPWPVSPISRLAFENNTDACFWILQNDEDKLSHAIRIAAYKQNNAFLDKLINWNLGSVSPPFNSTEAMEYLMITRWSEAARGAAMTGNKERVNEIISMASNGHYAHVHLSATDYHIVYGAAYAGHTSYVDELLAQGAPIVAFSDALIAQGVPAEIVSSGIKNRQKYINASMKPSLFSISDPKKKLKVESTSSKCCSIS